MTDALPLYCIKKDFTSFQVFLICQTHLKMGSFFSLISTEQTMTKQNCFLEFFCFRIKIKEHQTFQYETCSLSLEKKKLLSTVTLILLLEYMSASLNYVLTIRNDL